MNGMSPSRSAAAASFIAASRSSKPPLSTATHRPFPPAARTSLAVLDALHHVSLDGGDAGILLVRDRVELEQLRRIMGADDVVGDTRGGGRRKLLVLERRDQLRSQGEHVERARTAGLRGRRDGGARI